MSNRPHGVTDKDIEAVLTLRTFIEKYPQYADLPIVVFDGHDTHPIWNDSLFYTHGGEELRKEVEMDGYDWDEYCANDDILGGKLRLVFSPD